MFYGGIFLYPGNYAARGSHIGNAVNQDQLSGNPVFFKFRYNDRFCDGDGNHGNFIFLQNISFQFLSRVNINFIADFSHNAGNQLCTGFYQKIFSKGKLSVIHPEQFGLKGIRSGKAGTGFYDASSGDIHLPIQLESNRLSLYSTVRLAVRHQNTADMGALPAWQNTNLVSLPDGSTLHLSLKAPELMIGTADSLNGKIKAIFVLVGFSCVYRLQIIQKHRPMIPADLFRATGDVVSLGGGNRNNNGAVKSDLLFQLLNLLFNFQESLLTVSGQIHFVDGKNKVTDSHQGADARVPSGLGQHSLCRINQDDRQIRKGSSTGHVSGIFLVSGSVRADKASAVCCKIPVCHIYGNSLFPFRRKPVQKQRIINGTAAAAGFGVQLQGFFLIRVNQLRVVQKVSDQR